MRREGYGERGGCEGRRDVREGREWRGGEGRGRDD